MNMEWHARHRYVPGLGRQAQTLMIQFGFVNFGPGGAYVMHRWDGWDLIAWRGK